MRWRIHPVFPRRGTWSGEMALVSSQPLLNGPGRRGTSRRLVAGAIAAVCAVAALALIATAVGHFKGDARRSSMLQRTASAVAVPAKAQALADEVPMMAQPVYYVPLSSAPGAGGVPVKKEALAQPRPVIYYYVPESSIQNLAENATAATNATAAVQAKPEFKCTAAHLVEVSNEVMPKWDKCKESSDYVVPNKDAKRRLMGWVWEGNGDPNLPMPMMLANGTNASAGAAAPKGEKLADCEAKALGDTCVKLEGCANPVCSSYYNEPEIERLCGVCTMKVSSWFGCFAKDAMVRFNSTLFSQAHTLSLAATGGSETCRWRANDPAVALYVRVLSYRTDQYIRNHTDVRSKRAWNMYLCLWSCALT